VTDQELRDWFAGRALGGLLAGKHAKGADGPGDIAAMAYAIADAMLAKRAWRLASDEPTVVDLEALLAPDTGESGA
jgi:hypothetical protein